MKVIWYGVRKTDEPFFHQINKKFKYEITLEPSLLTHENIETAKGYDAVVLRANCVADQKNLDILKDYQIKYLLTRTVGVNHIDVNYAKKLDFLMARVPTYSPNSVSELTVSLGLGLMRNTFYMASHFAHKNFKVDEFMFAKEVRNSTIGIIGTGKIGIEVAKSFKGMGAKILGYDAYPNNVNKTILEYVDLNILLKESDLVSLHIPYLVGQNENFVNQEFLAKMKNQSFLINAARGELVDNQALYEAIVSNKLKGAALDTISQEAKIYFQDFKDEKLPIEIYDKLANLYPRVIMTPHIGSYTDEATKNMIEISFENLKELASGIKNKNQI